MIFFNAILIGFIGGLLGCLFDITIRFLSNKNYTIDKKEWFKLFLNFPVYFTGFFLIFWLSKIQFLHYITFWPITIIAGGIICSGIELAFGLLYNKVLKLNVWDYSWVRIGKIILNLWGQISVLHGVLWGLLTPVCFIIIKFLEKLF